MHPTTFLAILLIDSIYEMSVVIFGGNRTMLSASVNKSKWWLLPLTRGYLHFINIYMCAASICDTVFDIKLWFELTFLVTLGIKDELLLNSFC